MDRKKSGSPKGVSNGEWRSRMKAEYTCVAADGKKVAVVCDTQKSIDDIKAIAVEEHKTAIVDVIDERPIGGGSTWADEDDDSDSDEDEKNDGLDDGEPDADPSDDGDDE